MKKIDAINEYSIDFNHFQYTFLRKPGALRDSLALKSNKELYNIFFIDYSMNGKVFLEDYFNDNLKITKGNDSNETLALSSPELDLITQESKSQLDSYSFVYK